jgi:HAD domain in Swiss Army Knife RNA repair proteins
MNVIFLDIDGVLATDKEFMRSTSNFHKKNPIAKELRIPYPFNPGCVKIFNEILEKTNFDIVLSSDWKFHWNLEEIDKIFKFNGVIKSPFSVTIENKWKFLCDLEDDRHFQIMSWVEKNKPENWIAIDDLDLTKLFMVNNLTENFFLTRSNEGIKQLSLKNKILKKIGHVQKSQKANN